MDDPLPEEDKDCTEEEQVQYQVAIDKEKTTPGGSEPPDQPGPNEDVDLSVVEQEQKRNSAPSNQDDVTPRQNKLMSYVDMESSFMFNKACASYIEHRTQIDCVNRSEDDDDGCGNEGKVYTF